MEKETIRRSNIFDLKARLKRLAATALIFAAIGGVSSALRPVFAQGAAAAVEELPIPPGTDMFNLDLAQTIAFSQSKNFQVLGHSYFKGPWLTPSAQAAGLGAGLQTPRVHNGIAYLGGYPPTLFGVLVADVKNPRAMRVLSFIPCNAGTRCNYLRVNNDRNILVGAQDTNNANPNEPPAGQPLFRRGSHSMMCRSRRILSYSAFFRRSLTEVLTGSKLTIGTFTPVQRHPRASPEARMNW